ncbi:MAG: peptide deformylase [Clostridiales bacterium GWF2_36_10]|nr:MAG: peptide deformylase [Clostridiales bacterium GWF2_36_10]HAN20808.1 peptide deformylase [Clostridiales bacterium]
MAILNILKEGDDILRKICRPVEKIDKRILTLLDDMKETMILAKGIGLAAPQVGVLRRVVIVDNGEKILELINPEIIKTDETQEGPEACLSLPGKCGIVKRPLKVTVKATDRNGKEYTVFGEGLTARAFCHEIDHLNGILYTDLAIEMIDPKDDYEVADEEE